MKLKDLTHTNKENMPAYSGTESQEPENSNHSPIKAIAQFEQK